MKTPLLSACLLAALVPGTAPALAARPSCLAYGSPITLQGVLLRRVYPGAPNYESVAKGDTPESFFLIHPGTHACVAAGSDAAQPPVARTGNIQLVFNTEGAQRAYSRLRPQLNRAVTCSGTLMHAMSGHHHTPVLLTAAHCEAATRP